MLGEQIGETHGKRTVRRVVSTDGGGFKVEVSFEGTSKLLGLEMNEIGRTARDRGRTAACSAMGRVWLSVRTATVPRGKGKA